MFYNKGASQISVDKGSHLTGFLHTKPTPSKSEYWLGFKRIFGSVLVPFTFLFSLAKRGKTKTNDIVFDKKGKTKLASKASAKSDISAAIAEKMLVNMAPKNVNKKPKSIPRNVKKITAVPIMALLVGSAFFAMFAFNSPEYTVFIQDGTNVTAVKTKARDVKTLLVEEGITLGGEDKVSVSLDQTTTDNLTIVIKRAFPVTITTKDGPITVELAEGTVKDALDKANIYVWQDDKVEPSTSTELTSGMNITYQQVSIKYEEATESIAYKTEKVNNSSMTMGTTKVTQEGQNGTKTVKYKLVYVDGELSNKDVIDTVVTKSAVNKIIAVGTKTVTKTTTASKPSRSSSKTASSSKTTTTSSSVSISAAAQAAGVSSSEVKKVLKAETTAYTHTGSRTATGTWPKIGTVAVNPNQIPYGTKLYIEGYGYATAEDTGGFISSSKVKIDLFMNSEAECIVYGRHYNVTIYVLK